MANVELINQILNAYRASGISEDKLTEMKAELQKLNETQLQQKLNEALNHNTNWGVGDVVEFSPSSAEAETVSEVTEQNNEDEVEDTVDDSGILSKRTIKNAGGNKTTVIEYSNGFPSKRTITNNGTVTEETTYEISTQPDGTKIFVITAKNLLNNKTTVTKALGVDSNGNITDDIFLSREVKDENTTTSTEIMTGAMLLNIIKLYPKLNFDTSKISEGHRYLCERITNSDGATLTLNIYNTGSVTQLDSGNAFKLLQSKADGSIQKYDGKGNTITTTNAGDGWERLAKRFFRDTIKNNPKELSKIKTEIAALNHNKSSLQAGEEILIPGEFDADSYPILHTQSPEKAKQLADTAEKNLAVARVNYSSVTGETTLTKDYPSVEAYAREMLINEGVANPSKKQINDRKNEIIALNGGKTSYKKDDVIKTVVAQVSPQTTQKLVQYGFEQKESNFIFYQRFNRLEPAQQQSVLRVLQYCKTNNITDPNKIKAKILEIFPDINLFDSGKTITAGGNDPYTYSSKSNPPVALETFITDKLGLDLETGNGKLLYARLCQLPQSELNKIPYSKFNASQFKNISFSRILDMFGQYTNVHTTQERQDKIRMEQNSPAYPKKVAIETIRNVVASCRQALEQHHKYLKDNMFTNLGEIMVEDIRFYGGTELIPEIAKHLGFKSGKLDALTKSLLSKIDELKNLGTKLMTLDPNSSDFDKKFKEVMGVDFNIQKVEQFMNLQQRISQNTQLGIPTDKKKDNEQLEQLLNEIMGDDFKSNVSDYLSWSQGAGAVAEIAVLTYTTMGIGSAISGTIEATTAVGRFGVGALTLGSYSGGRFALNFLDDIDNIIRGEKTIGGVFVGEANAQSIKQGAQIIRDFVTGALSEDEAKKQLEKLHLSFDDFMTSRGGQWVVNTTTSAIVGGVAGAASPIFQKAGQIGTQAGQKFAEKFPTIGNMLGLNAKTIQEITAKIITSNAAGISGADFMAQTYAALNATNIAGKGLQFLTETMLFYMTDLPISVIQEVLSESNHQLEDALKNGTLGEYLADKLKDQAINLLKVKSIGMIVGMMVSANTATQPKNPFEEFETLENSTIRYEDATIKNPDGTYTSKKVVTIEGPSGKIFIDGDITYCYAKDGQLITTENVSSNVNFESLDAGSKTAYLLGKMMQFEQFMKANPTYRPVQDAEAVTIPQVQFHQIGNSSASQGIKTDNTSIGVSSSEPAANLTISPETMQTQASQSIYGKLSNNVKQLLQNPTKTLTTFMALSLNPNYSAKVTQLIAEIRELGHEINKTQSDVLEVSDLTTLTEVLLNSMDVVEPRVENIVKDLNELSEIIENPEILKSQETSRKDESTKAGQPETPAVYFPINFEFNLTGQQPKQGFTALLEPPKLTPPNLPKSLTGRIKTWIKGTPIGRRISTGIQNAKGALSNTFTIPQEGNEAFYENYKNILKNPKRTLSTIESLAQNPEYIRLCDELAKHYVETGRNPETFINDIKNCKDVVKIYQMLIEQSGVGPTKLAQIISNMTGLMDQIGEKSPELRTAIENTRSHCNRTRTLEETQAEVDNAFPVSDADKISGIQHRFKIIKDLKTASMGETYIAEKPDGTKCIVKMLKKGVDAKQLELEEQFYSLLIRTFNDNPESAEQQVSVISQCYKDWADELDFVHEFEANSKLAQGSQRYTVARATDLSKDGKCLVMDIARGVQMEDIMEMMKFYLENPSEYFTKYAKQIEANPWLGNPEQVMTKLPETLSKTFIEQYIFMKDGGQSLMHGDPHMGNYFIYENENGVLTPEFIDTGLCIERSADAIRSDIRFFASYAVGNTEGIAEYFISKCQIAPLDIDAATAAVEKDIRAEIFNQRTNITNFAEVQTAITKILDRHGLTIRPDEATAMKAQMQFLTGIADAYHISGRHFDINPFLKDLPKAVYYMAKEGVNPWSEISSSFNFAFHNQVQTASTAAQFIYKRKQ